jgi:acyl-CoA reductase-like NAD-dependent aldehyde dehydrogenase
VNILPGDGPECGNAIAVHEHIDKIAFTGSVEVRLLIKKKMMKDFYNRSERKFKKLPLNQISNVFHLNSVNDIR